MLMTNMTLFMTSLPVTRWLYHCRYFSSVGYTKLSSCSVSHIETFTSIYVASFPDLQHFSFFSLCWQ